MFRGNHVILHSYDKESWLFEEGNFVLEWVKFVDIKVGLLLDGAGDDFQGT